MKHYNEDILCSSTEYLKNTELGKKFEIQAQQWIHENEQRRQRVLAASGKSEVEYAICTIYESCLASTEEYVNIAFDNLVFPNTYTGSSQAKRLIEDMPENGCFDSFTPSYRTFSLVRPQIGKIKTYLADFYKNRTSLIDYDNLLDELFFDVETGKLDYRDEDYTVEPGTPAYAIVLTLCRSKNMHFTLADFAKYANPEIKDERSWIVDDKKCRTVERCLKRIKDKLKAGRSFPIRDHIGLDGVTRWYWKAKR